MKTETEKPGKVLDDAKLEADWIAALRSRKYKQGKFCLRRGRATEFSYCCLGVLADLCGDVTNMALAFPYDESGIPIGNYHGLNRRSMEKLGELNDFSGADFNEIADLIEKGKVGGDESDNDND